MVVGVVATTQPDEVRPAELNAALGTGPAFAPTPAPTTTTATAPLLDSLPTALAPPPAPPSPSTRAVPTSTAAAPRTTTRPAAPRSTARTPAPPASGSQTAQVVQLTNRARVNAGCSALSVDPRLTAAAEGHSEDMSAKGYFAHDSQDGRSFSDRITAQGYPSPGGENIAQGQQDAQEVVTAWMNSPGHRRNIEDCSFTTIGVGLTGTDRYWTQDFGR
jgi:uncharacterized protein YkwD